MNENFTLKGTVEAILTDTNGNIIDQQVSNTIVTLGKAMIVNRIQATPTVNSPSHIELGTGATAVAPGDTALATTLSGSRGAATSSLLTTTLVNDTVQFSTTWAAGSATSSAIKEAGLFNASTAGTLVARTVFTNVIDKAAADTLTLNWKLQIT
jgi:hypothetical protein